jgi:hypothetical protein
VALPGDLLAQAKHLASREPKRPRQASLRRAVSTAYYALYHLLIHEGSSVMSPPQPPLLRARVWRAFAHEDMKQVCQQFQHGKISNLNAALRAVVVNPLEAEFATIAGAFVQLQEARHSADYDTIEVFSRPDVLSTIDLADQAFAAWKAVKDKPNANAFLAALLLNRHWRASS